jgi:aldose 1-epimerase
MGRFVLNGKRYELLRNEGTTTVHGGPDGFSSRVWRGQVVGQSVEMTLVSPDGDMGFPGELHVTVRYTVRAHALHVEYSTTTTKTTVVSLTNHSYFNLKGDGRGTVLDTVLTVAASRFLPTRQGLIPTGEMRDVSGTAFDFRKPAAIGARIHDDDEQLKLAGGYGHNFVLDGAAGMHQAAEMFDPETGRTLEVSTTEPGVQVYSSNLLGGSVKGRGGVAYPRYSALCLETQHFPDSPNEPAFPSTVLRSGKMLRSVSVYAFGVRR